MAEGGVVAPDYGSVEFWNKVYTAELPRTLAPQEWLLTYSHFHAQRWCRFLPTSGSVLDAGCGDSTFFEDAMAPGGCLVDADVVVTGVDAVAAVVAANTRRAAAAGVGRCAFVHADVRALGAAGLTDATFHTVFDKSTMDALKCSGVEGDAASCAASTGAYVTEVFRVLKPGGKFCVVTLHEPEEIVAIVKSFAPCWCGGRPDAGDDDDGAGGGATGGGGEPPGCDSAAPPAAACCGREPSEWAWSSHRVLVCESEWDSEELQYVYLLVFTK